MAHQGTIVENGMTYNVTEFDHTAQEIDDTVSNLGGASTPQGAIAALGAGVRKNWLINPFFSINQRGASSYSAGNTVDGWVNSGADSVVAVNSDGVIFSVNQDASGRRYLAQALEDDWLGVEATFSILTQDGTLYTGTGNYPDGVGYTDVLNIPNIGTLRLDAQNPDHQRAYVILNQGASIKLRAAKLEKGAGQTLCYMDSSGVWQLLEQPDPLEEIKCKRYQIALPQGNTLNYSPIGYGYIFGGNSARILIPTPVKMRTNPTLVFISGNISGLSILAGENTFIPTSVSTIFALEYGVSINFTIPSGATNGPCTLRCTSGYALLDANLS